MTIPPVLRDCASTESDWLLPPSPNAKLATAKRIVTDTIIFFIVIMDRPIVEATFVAGHVSLYYFKA
jgi:hypothetical protein